MDSSNPGPEHGGPPLRRRPRCGQSRRVHHRVQAAWRLRGLGGSRLRYRTAWLAVAVHSRIFVRRSNAFLHHRFPRRDPAIIIERAVDLLLAKALKERFGVKAPSEKATRTKAKTRPAALETEASGLVAATNPPRRNSRYIPRAVVREVYARDQGQCSFVGSNGKRCSERGLLELHHVYPFARGGEATVGNLRLVCRTHNTLYAEHDFGRAHMQSKRSRRQQAAPGFT